MSAAKGFLLVTMEPPPNLEEEFNDWYDTEHLPERLAIQGFETARRFVCVSGWPKYLALYDLADAGVLGSEAYKKHSGDGFSPWTKRILNRVRGQYRASGDQIYPGDALTGELCRMALIRARHVLNAEREHFLAGVRTSFEQRPETRKIRVFKSIYNNASDYIALVESHAPSETHGIDIAAFGPSAARIDLVNEYVPYWTRGVLPGVFPNP